MTKPERIVASFGEHPTFIRSEHTALVVVDHRAKAGSGWAAQVDVADGPVRQHAREDKRGIKLPEGRTLPVDLQNPAEAAFIERKPLLRIILHELLRLDRETKRGKRSQEDAVQPQLQIFIDDVVDAIEARFRGGHQGPDPVRTENFTGPANPGPGPLMTVCARSP